MKYQTKSKNVYYDIENFDDTNILINTDHKLSDDITFKNVVKSTTRVTKDYDTFYSEPFRSI